MKKFKEKFISLLAGMIFMITFGLIDNLFLVMGMDSLDTIVDMLGNTFSDVLGAIAGMIMSWVFLKLFKVKASDNILVEIIGVFIGCLIPVIIWLMYH